jgi:hypothetical protein
LSAASSRLENKASLEALFDTCLFFYPEDGGSVFFPKHRLAFNGLHGVISQKIELFKVQKLYTPRLLHVGVSEM